MLTPEQRLDRAERILIATIKSGRRTRSEWRFKINSLIDAQIRDEAEWRVRTAKIDEQLSQNAAGQAQNQKAIAELRESQAELKESQKLTDKALREFIESLRKNPNGNSD
ncbi:MAG TPA: hypothetical protein VFH96_05710 [Pyrinomonadaceae bacterium]|nr:hypothetical protein [Pyrinomonadaceae bacterium]